MNNCVEPSKSRIMEIVTKVKTELIIKNMKMMIRYKMIIRTKGKTNFERLTLTRTCSPVCSVI